MSPIDDDHLQAWIVEAQQRLEDIRSGREATIPAAEVLRKGRAMIERAKQTGRPSHDRK